MISVLYRYHRRTNEAVVTQDNGQAPVGPATEPINTERAHFGTTTGPLNTGRAPFGTTTELNTGQLNNVAAVVGSVAVAAFLGSILFQYVVSIIARAPVTRDVMSSTVDCVLHRE